MLIANLAFYDAIYTVGAANQLGVIDGQVSGFKAIHYPSALGVDTGISTFQDDFITGASAISQSSATRRRRPCWPGRRSSPSSA